MSLSIAQTSQSAHGKRLAVSVKFIVICATVCICSSCAMRPVRVNISLCVAVILRETVSFCQSVAFTLHFSM